MCVGLGRMTLRLGRTGDLQGALTGPDGVGFLLQAFCRGVEARRRVREGTATHAWRACRTVAICCGIPVVTLGTSGCGLDSRERGASQKGVDR